MKKQIILLLFLAISMFSFSQNSIEIIKDSFPTYQGIIKIDSKTSKQLYANLKEWTAVNFKSARNVIQLDDPDNGKLIIKGLSNFYYTYMLVPIDCICYYSIAFDVKDEKFRYTINITDVTAGTDGVSSMSYLIENPNKKNSKKQFEQIVKIKTDFISSLANIKDQKLDNW